MIYFDSAATSLYRPHQVAEAVAAAITNFGNSSRGTYETALESSRVIFDTRCLINELFDGYGPEQTAFTMNSTESLNMAIKGLIRPGDRVVTTFMEHNSVLRPLYELEAAGASVVFAGMKEMRTASGTLAGLDMEELHRLITPGTRAVVCTHGSNVTGNLLDLETIGRWCREAGCLLLVDASQTAGHFPISMKKMNLDVLCFTGHKGLLGPQGTGGLCVRPGLELKPLISGGSGIQTFSKEHPKVMPTALEAGTINSHGLAGLRAALLWLREQGLGPIQEREQMLAKRFYLGIRDLPGIQFYGDYRSYETGAAVEAPLLDRSLAGQQDQNRQITGQQSQNRQITGQQDQNLQLSERAAMVTFNLGDEDSAVIADILAADYEIAVRAGGHCAPRLHETLGTVEQGAVRFSFSFFNTEEQVDAAIDAVREIQYD